MVRFRWDEQTEEEYFEFLITPQELTGDITLTVTDFIDPGEEEDARRVWDDSIRKLKRSLGVRY